MSESKERPIFNFNFHGNVGQQIGNVERMEVHFDKDMQMQVSRVEEMNVHDEKNMPTRVDSAVETPSPLPAGELLFQFIHPEVEESEEQRIHQSVKKLVKRFGVKEICEYLLKMAGEKKILLPQSVKSAYDELQRMGMPEGEGYAYKTFEKYYTR